MEKILFLIKKGLPKPFFVCPGSSPASSGMAVDEYAALGRDVAPLGPQI